MLRHARPGGVVARGRTKRSSGACAGFRGGGKIASLRRIFNIRQAGSGVLRPIVFPGSVRDRISVVANSAPRPSARCPGMGVTLSAFLEQAGSPSGEQCETVRAQAIELLDQICVHPAAMPLQRLRDLPLSPSTFYRDLLGIFAEFGDRHTQCQLPDPFLRTLVCLPFAAAGFFENGELRRVTGSALDEFDRATSSRPGTEEVSIAFCANTARCNWGRTPRRDWRKPSRR